MSAPAVVAGPRFTHAPPPKYATQRDPSWLTEGAEIARTARLLGLEPMPWQQYVWDVATEYRLDSFGRRIYRYAVVFITVPRQSGKTTLTGPVRVHRLITRPRIAAFSTAQTGKDAAKRMRDLIERVVNSPIGRLFKPRYSNGSAGLTCLGNGSTVTQFAPTAGAIHGETPALVDLDEVWHYSKEQGDGLLGGIRPAQITLHGTAQLWMLSTMGTAASEFMNEWVEKGRAAEPGVAYFEWSMPDGGSLDDPDIWPKFHPAVNNTISIEALIEEAGKLSYAERMRAFGNVVIEADDPIITAEDWAALAREPAGRPSLSDLSVAFEVAPDNASAAVMAAWRDDEGAPCLRVVHQAPGTAWLVTYVRQLVKEWALPGLVADDGGPNKRFIAALTAGVTDEHGVVLVDPVEVRRMTLPELGAATEQLLAAARDEQTLRHDGSAALATAVAHAVVRTTNGVARFSRDHSGAPIPSLIGGALALYAYDTAPAVEGMQIF